MRHAVLGEFAVMNFRTFKRAGTDLSPPYVSLAGENASGKSNFLVAILRTLSFDHDKMAITNMCRVADPPGQVGLSIELPNLRTTLYRRAVFDGSASEVPIETKHLPSSTLVLPRLIDVSESMRKQLPVAAYLDPLYTGCNIDSPEFGRVLRFMWPANRVTELNDLASLMTELWSPKGTPLTVSVFPSRPDPEDPTWVHLMVIDPYIAAFPSRTQSSGFRHTYRMAAARVFYSGRPCVLLIDEPEQHLSRVSQLRVASWLRNMAGPQFKVIVATHSDPFVASDTASSRLVVRIPSGASTVIHPTQVRDNVALRRYTGAAIGGHDPLVAHLLVEGACEVYLFERAIDEARKGHAQLHWTAGDLRIVDMGGRENVSYWKRLHRAAGLPCMVLLDNESASVDRMKDMKSEGTWDDALDLLVPLHSARARQSELENLYPMETAAACLHAEVIASGRRPKEEIRDFGSILQSHPEWLDDRWSDVAIRLIGGSRRKAKGIVHGTRLAVFKRLVAKGGLPDFAFEVLRRAHQLSEALVTAAQGDGLPYVGITPPTWTGPGPDPVLSDTHKL